MEHNFFDRYAFLDSPVHRLDPRVKLILTFFFVILVVSTSPVRLLAFLIDAGLLLWIIAFARLPLRWILLRALAVLPFSALVALWLPFLGPAPDVSLLGGRLTLSVPGLWIFTSVTLKALLGAIAVLILVSTTPMSLLLSALDRLGVPVILIDLLALTYRYIFVLTGQVMSLRRAAAARGYRPRWIGQALLVGRLIGNLFVRSYARAERLYAAMVLRGYDGHMPIARPLVLRSADFVVLLLLVPALLVVRIIC